LPDSPVDVVDSEAGLTPQATRYALVMLTIAYAFNFIDRQILVILQEPIKLEMGLRDWQLGLLSGFAFALVYVTAGIPIAYWADRGNRKNIIALAITVWSGMTALSGAAQGFGQLLAARVGVGLGEAGGSPPAHAMISDYFPPERRASALGFYSAGLHFGIVLGFLLGAFIEAALGWRAAFMAVGLPGVAFALIFFLTVREPRRGRWDSGEAAGYQPSVGETVQTLLGFRSFWFIAFGCGLTAFGGYGVGNFIPSYLVRSHGIEGTELGILMAIGGGGAGLVGTLLGGAVADRLGVRDRRWYLWVPAAAGILALPLTLPMLLSDNRALVVPTLVLVTVLTNTYLGPCLATCHGLVPPAMRALTSAILFFVLNLIGLGFGPLCAGLLSDHFQQAHGADGLRYALLVVAAIATSGILLFVLGARSLPGDFERRERMLEEAGAR
jgi:predicted MFS family arabinose efflux permease